MDGFHVRGWPPQQGMPPQQLGQSQPIQRQPHPPPQQALMGVYSPQPTLPKIPAVDYRTLLLSLSDSYIAEARSIGALISHRQLGADVAQYHKLVATSLACLETVLNKQRVGLLPRQEALIQLRYAKLLFEETENHFEAETTLSRAIPFCEKNRLLDLKYTMHHLLIRVLFTSNPKAAFKSLDSAIAEVTSWQYMAWVYAFRFLRASLCLQSGALNDCKAAAQNLRDLSDLARSNGDSAISTIARILEAASHLRINLPDSAIEAQRAIASARAEQLNSAMKLPHLRAMLHFLDISASLHRTENLRCREKLQLMHDFLDEISKEKMWRRDGTFLVPIKRTAGSALTLETGGIFKSDSDGFDCLVFSWLSRIEVYLVGYFISATATFYQSQGERQGLLQYFNETLKMSEDEYQFQELCGPEPLFFACERARWRRTVRCHLFLYLALIKCESSEWEEAKEHLKTFSEAIKEPGIEPSSDLSRLAIYLNGTVQQATGNLVGALEAYSHPDLSLLSLPSPGEHTTTRIHKQLTVLAVMGIIQIIQQSSHPDHHLAETYLELLQQFYDPNIVEGPNHVVNSLHFCSAYYLLVAIVSTKDSILHRKEALQRSLNGARDAGNKQLLSILMTYLYNFFFTGIVDDKAIKSAKTARQAAGQAGSKTWACVTDGVLAEALELDGRPEDAQKTRAEGEALTEALPFGLGDE